jgi:hypothetical protein
MSRDRPTAVGLSDDAACGIGPIIMTLRAAEDVRSAMADWSPVRATFTRHALEEHVRGGELRGIPRRSVRAVRAIRTSGTSVAPADRKTKPERESAALATVSETDRPIRGCTRDIQRTSVPLPERSVMLHGHFDA